MEKTAYKLTKLIISALTIFIIFCVCNTEGLETGKRSTVLRDTLATLFNQDFTAVNVHDNATNGVSGGWGCLVCLWEPVCKLIYKNDNKNNKINFAILLVAIRGTKITSPLKL